MSEDPPHFSVLILAAGESSRMGSPKPLLPLGRKNFISHVLSNPFFQRDDIHPHVVLGFEPENILPYIPKSVDFSINPHFEKGRISSVQCGLRELPSKISGFFLLPVDCPLITEDIFESVRSAFNNAQSICIPSYENQRGHPPLIGNAYFEEILQLKEDEPLRALYQRYVEKIIHIPVSTDSVLHNINTPEDYHSVLIAYEKSLGE